MYIALFLEVPGGMQMDTPEAEKDPPAGKGVNFPQQAPSVLHCYWLVQTSRSDTDEVVVVDIPPAVPVVVDIPPPIPVEVDIPPGIPSA